MLKNINFSSVIDKIKMFLKNNKKRMLIVLAILILIVFSFAYLFFVKNENNSKTKNNVSSYNYTEQLETKIKEMLLSVSGIKSANVFVMTSGTPKVNYLMETTETEVSNSNGSTKTISSKVVYEKSNGVTAPIVVSTSHPEILGVLIVINDVSASTKNSIKNSISIVLNISVDCISILQE